MSEHDTEWLRVGLADLARQTAGADLRERVLQTSRRLTFRRAALGAAVAVLVVTLGAAWGLQGRRAALPPQPASSSPEVDRSTDAAPSGTATATESAAPSSTSPTAPTGGPTRTPNRAIRGTDWRNVHLVRKGSESYQFSNGTARWQGSTCRILPNGTQPAYGDILTYAPVVRTNDEDALVLVDCGTATAQELLIVSRSADSNELLVTLAVSGDPSNGPSGRTTFTAYRIDGGSIVVTVRKANGTTETRRYAGSEFGYTWTRTS
jgi:hypothetical protein